MPDPQTAWLFGLASMLLVFLLIYHKENRLRQALIYALLWGKILATVFMLLHLDIPLFHVYTVKNGVITGSHTITANMLIFLSFLTTNATIAAWPELKRELGLKGSVIL